MGDRTGDEAEEDSLDTGVEEAGDISTIGREAVAGVDEGLIGEAGTLRSVTGFRTSVEPGRDADAGLFGAGTGFFEEDDVDVNEGETFCDGFAVFCRSMVGRIGDNGELDE